MKNTIEGLNAFAREVHENAVAHGWWEEDRGLPEILMLCVSELAEALEEYRADRPILWYSCEEGDPDVCRPEDESDCTNFGHEESCRYRGKKPEGISVELADCIIRILDYCGKDGIDIEEAIRIKHEYNETRPYRHGGKRA